MLWKVANTEYLTLQDNSRYTGINRIHGGSEAMNKKEFIEQLSKKTGLTKKQAREALDTTLDLIVSTTKKKNKVTFTGFGTFEARKQKSTKRINPRTGESLKVPSKFVPKFRAGKAYKDSMPKK
jgi:DNA-binding protein HU-beta